MRIIRKKPLFIAGAVIVASTIAGCGASGSSVPETTVTTEATTTAETTTTSVTNEGSLSQETTTDQAGLSKATENTEAPTEAWLSKYADAAIPPKKDPDDVWKGIYKIEVRLKNGVHIYLPSFGESFKDGQEAMGTVGYYIQADNAKDPLIYTRYDEENKRIYYGQDYFEVDDYYLHIGAHEGIIDIYCGAGNEVPGISREDGDEYKIIGEKYGGVYYLLFSAPSFYNNGQFTDFGVKAGDIDYYKEYADKIADTVWLENTGSASGAEAQDHPEDEVLMNYIREYYRSHEKVQGGYPIIDEGHKSYAGYYTKYAIADFDADGTDELAVESTITWTKYNAEEHPELDIYKSYSIDFDYASASYGTFNTNFSGIAFYNNGVAESANTYIKPENIKGEVIDNRFYYLLNEDLLGRLNYSKENVGEFHPGMVLYYYKKDGAIHKTLNTFSENDLDVVKTREEYNNDIKTLRSGEVINIQVKDFTAENLGL